MNAMHPWRAANALSIHPSPDAGSGFSIGFDARIPSETQAELRRFVGWVEDNFDMPVQLWVDFEYRHYLLNRERKRAGYLFYWMDAAPGETIAGRDDLPVIRLPVRTEHSSMDEILFSFAEAIGCYFIWLANGKLPALPRDEDTEEILQAYKGNTGK